MAINSKRLLAYSAMEEYELEEYREKIEAKYPDISLTIERVSTAELHKIVVEQGEGGKWDVILGWALTTMLDPGIQKFFAKLDIPELGQLPVSAVDADKRWFCPSAFIPAFCTDLQYANALGLEPPVRWSDLARDEYKSKFVIPDPSYSGAGYLHLVSLIQNLGEDRAWGVLEKVAANQPRIARSAFAPCQAVIDKQAYVGITVTIAAARLKRLGMSVNMQVPFDAAGCEPEGFAMNARTENSEAALRVLRWMLTTDAGDIYHTYSKLALSASSRKYENSNPEVKTIDVWQAAKRRNEICLRWSKIFDVN